MSNRCLLSGAFAMSLLLGMTACAPLGGETGAVDHRIEEREAMVAAPVTVPAEGSGLPVTRTTTATGVQDYRAVTDAATKSGTASGTAGGSAVGKKGGGGD